MFAVIFEVKPRADRWDLYVETAGRLRPDLEATEGFVANERWRSVSRPGWLLSLSLWRDEKALVRWRAHGAHHGAQRLGRSGVFEDYHLRVGEVVGPGASRLDGTEAGRAPAIGFGEVAPAGGTEGLMAMAAFEHIATAGRRLVLSEWTGMDAARMGAPAGTSLVQVIRDYGLHDRREAPQYHPPPGC